MIKWTAKNFKGDLDKAILELHNLNYVIMTDWDVELDITADPDHLVVEFNECDDVFSTDLDALIHDVTMYILKERPADYSFNKGDLE